MNTVLQTFLSKIAIGVGVVGADARGLLGILATMELILVALWWAYSGNEALSRLLRKVLTIFFFIWVIDNYSFILTWVTDGFVFTGEKAAGGAAVDINDPSGILWAGLQVAKPILEHAKAQASFFGSFFDGLVSLLSAFIICFAYFILAFQIFLTRIEFALISTLGLILVPFGVFKYTSFMAEKVFGAVISFGVKLMVLAFVVSVGFPLMQTLSLPSDPSWVEMLSVMFGSLAMALLSIHAPGVASGLLNGGPSLTAGSAAGAGVAVAAGGAGTLLGGYAAAKIGTGAVGTGVAATHAATSGLGGVHGLVDAGRQAASNGSGPSAAIGKYSKVAGATSGTVGAVFRGAAKAGIASPVTTMKENLADSYKQGRARVGNYISTPNQTENTKKASEGTEKRQPSSEKGEGSNRNSGAKQKRTEEFDAEEGRGERGSSKGRSGSKGGNTSNRSGGNPFSRTAYAAQTAASGVHSSQPAAGTQVKVRDERDD